MKRRRVLSAVRCLLLLAVLFFFTCPAECYVKASDSAEEKGQTAGSRISIDSRHKYKGMAESFSEGYEPSVKKDVMTLVVPFLSDGKMEKNRITVGIDFESGQDGPFYYKNYRREVRLSEEGVYLYRCRLRLKEERLNGQYPLHLWAEGKQGENLIRQEFTVYIEITDGIPRVGDGGSGDGGSEDGRQADMGGELSGESGMLSAEQSIPETSQPSEEEKNSQPRLMITAASLQGNTLEAGDDIAWKLAVQNCSSRYSVENVKITLLCESKDIIFEKNAWYFEKTLPKETMDLSQNIKVARKAAAEPVPVQFQIEYEDAKGGSYTSTEAVRLLVRQPQRAMLANLSFPEQVYASDTEFLEFQVQNTGLSTIYNVTVRLEAKGLFPQQEVFLGNIEGGNSADGEQKVFVGTLDMDEQGNISDEGGEKYGDTSGNVVLSYENEQGEVTEQKLEIRTSIQEAETVNLKIEEQKPKTNQWWITVVFFAVTALVLAIIWLYLRMKHYQEMVT